jgi:hypothetical protein
MFTEFQHVEVTVLGAASGQQVMNVMHYRAVDGSLPTTIQGFVNQFRTEWRDNFIPLLHDSYVAQAYLARVISGMIWLGASDVPPTLTRPAVRYSEQAIAQGGTALDTGDLVGAAHPTFTAVSAEKVCGQVFDASIPPVALTQEKLIRGGMRIGPIVEVDTEVAEGNALTAAKTAAVAAALGTIRHIAVPGEGEVDMEVLSFEKNRLPRTLPISGLPTFAHALVTSFIVNPFASTQVSRKQRARGGA